MSNVAVFFLEPTDRVRVSLRRFTFGRDKKCRQRGDWGHDASVVIEQEAPASAWPTNYSGSRHLVEDVISQEDPRWPTECEACGEPFQIDDEWQINADPLYRGAPDGNLYPLRHAPVGAMWDAHWMRSLPQLTGPDGIALVVKTPGGEWMVDSQASNCTRPGDLSHKCWVRRGDPRDPQGVRTGQPLHVSKDAPRSR